jgi:hypothetical protein
LDFAPFLDGICEVGDGNWEFRDRIVIGNETKIAHWKVELFMNP